MKYDAETFRQFLLGFQALNTRAERHQYVKDALKDVDGMLHENPFIRGLSQHLWAQTMGSQEKPDTCGKVIFHTEERFEAVAGSIESHMRGVTKSVEAFFYGMIGHINYHGALGQLTPEELAEYHKPYPKDEGLVIRGKPGTNYVLWRHEIGTITMSDGKTKPGQVWREIRTLLENPS